MTFLGVDIGGANLKVADGRGFSRSVCFPLWQRREELADAVQSLLRNSPPHGAVAITMTGELADCFRTKREGVNAILDAVAAATAAVGNPAMHVYRTDGTWSSIDDARQNPLAVAASNWHALAKFAGRFASTPASPATVSSSLLGTPPSALLIDIGSTTADLIPIVAGRPAAVGKTDPERLISGELVYTGVVRSPVCAIVSKLPWHRGLGEGHTEACPVAQEFFATAADAYVTLRELPEDPPQPSPSHDTGTATADGRPLTRECARDRLARSICADREMFTDADAWAASLTIREAQLNALAVAAQRVIRRMPAAPSCVILSGQGEFLGRRLAERLKQEGTIGGSVVSLSDRLDPAVSQCATAHALAVLAEESGLS